MVSGIDHPETSRHIWDALMDSGSTHDTVPMPLSFVLLYNGKISGMTCLTQLGKRRVRPTIH